MDDFIPPDGEIAKMLQAARTIAVVGLSQNPARPSYDVAEYLAAKGYEIVPVNPTITEWEGRKAYPTLRAVQHAGIRVDLVDVFRRPEEVGPVVDEAIDTGAPAIWFQLGVVNEEAAHRAQNAGMIVVMDRCTKIEHRRLVR